HLHLLGVDDHDVVAAIDVRREARLVLALEAQRHERREAAQHDAVGIDEDPLLVLRCRLGRQRYGRHGDFLKETTAFVAVEGAEYRRAGRRLSTEKGYVFQNLCPVVKW